MMRGLRTLVCFHQICGISYLSWNNFDKISFKRKVVIAIMNLTLLAMVIKYLHNSVATKIEWSRDRKYFNETKKSNFIFILSTTTSSGYVISMTYVFVLLLFKGKNILNFLKELNMKIQPNIEFKIGIKVVVGQILITLLVQSLYPLCRIIFRGVNNYSIKNHTIRFIEYTFLENIHSTFISLMVYYCYYIEEYILKLEQNFTSLSQTKSIYHESIKIHNSVKSFSQYFKKVIFILIILSSMCCVTNATIFYFHLGNRLFYTLPAIFECLIRIFIFCIFSNKIESSYSKLLDKFEKLELVSTEQKYSCLYHSFLNRMYSMRDDMCFTAFDLYKINMKTFMEIISLIITFCVILIQTD